MSWEVRQTMRSRTSFFNMTLFTKTVRRFWPIWSAYLFTMLLVLPVSLGSQLAGSLQYGNTDNVTLTLQRMPLRQAADAWIPAIIICVCMAIAVYSYLYSARSAGAYGSLPIKREGVFLSVALAGLVPLLAANLVVFGVTVAVEAAQGVLFMPSLWQWLAAMCLMDVFFFGFASFCATLTGNIVVLPLVYGVLNVTAYVVEAIAQAIFSQFVYGYSANGTLFTFISPPVKLYMTCTVTEQYTMEASDLYSVTGYSLEGMGIMCAYAVAGVVLLALAMLICRKRRMEAAGDVVAVRCLRPVFKYCLSGGCALCLGALLYSITAESEGLFAGYEPYALLLFMLLGAFIGYFAGEMLNRKSFAVFKGGRRWIGFGVVCVCCAAFVTTGATGLFGYERDVPDTNGIGSVSVYADGNVVEFRDPANIAAAVALHESIIDNKAFHTTDQAPQLSDADDYSGSVSIKFTYFLTDGSEMSRFYRINYTSQENADVYAAQALMNTPEAIAYRKNVDFEISEETVSYAYINYYTYTEGVGSEWTSLDLTAAEAAELYNDCIVPDVADRTLGRLWLVTDDDYYSTVYGADIYIECYERLSDGVYRYPTFYTVPTVDSARTNAWLIEHGVELYTELQVATAGYSAEPLPEATIAYN